MDDLVDVGEHVVSVTEDGVQPLLFEQLRTELDITAVIVDDPQPWEWDTVPPLGVLVREIAQRLCPGDDVTGWLYSQQEFARYVAEQEDDA